MLDPWPSTAVLLAARKRVSSVVHRPSLLQTMSSGRHLGEDQRGFAGILDTQSVKTISVGGIRGYDGAKKLSGRKRHLLVDTLSMVLKARVHSSNLQDRAAMPLVLESAQSFVRVCPSRARRPRGPVHGGSGEPRAPRWT